MEQAIENFVHAGACRINCPMAVKKCIFLQCRAG